MLFQGVSPLQRFKVGADIKVRVIGYRVLDANKLVISCTPVITRVFLCRIVLLVNAAFTFASDHHTDTNL